MTDFKVEFYNHSGGPVRANLFLDGQQRISIPPTKQGTLSGHILQGRDCIFSPYTKIVYHPDGTVTAKKRSGFKRKKTDWDVEFLNESPSIDIQIFTVGVRSIFIPKGVSVFYSADSIESVAEYSKVWFTEPRPDGGSRMVNAGGEIYVAPTTSDILKVRRQPKELEKLFEVRAQRIEEEKIKDLEWEQAQERRKLRLQEQTQ